MSVALLLEGQSGHLAVCALTFIRRRRLSMARSQRACMEMASDNLLGETAGKYRGAEKRPEEKMGVVNICHLSFGPRVILIRHLSLVFCLNESEFCLFSTLSLCFLMDKPFLQDVRCFNCRCEHTIK